MEERADGGPARFGEPCGRSQRGLPRWRARVAGGSQEGWPPARQRAQVWVRPWWSAVGTPEKKDERTFANQGTKAAWSQARVICCL